MGKMKKSPLVIFAVAIVALYIVIYILPRVTGALEITYTAEYGELEIGDSSTGYIVRNEFVYFTEKTGEENRYIPNNKLVRKGTRIMEVVSEDETEEAGDKEGSKAGEQDKAGSGEDAEAAASGEKTTAEAVAGEGSKEVTGLGTYKRFRENIKGKNRISTSDFVSQQEGIVSYNVDGFESMLTPANMAKKDKSFLDKLTNTDNLGLKRKTVIDTDPVFKICDRSRWYIITYVPRKSGDRYQPGTKLDIRLDEKYEITGKVVAVKDERREKRVTIKSDNYFREFTTIRKVPVDMVTDRAMGLIISNSSIVEKKIKKPGSDKKVKQKGVYVKRKTGDYEFVPVSILATDGKESAIEATRFRDAEGNSIDSVRSYDDVLRRPSGDMK